MANTQPAYEMLQPPTQSPTIEAALASYEGSFSAFLNSSPKTRSNSLNTSRVDLLSSDNSAVQREQPSPKKKRKAVDNPVGRGGRLLCTPCRHKKKGWKVLHQEKNKITQVVPAPGSFKATRTPLHWVLRQRPCRQMRWSKTAGT